MMAWLGANWKTTVSGIGAAIFGGLTTLAALPYQLGDIATLVPPDWKARIFTWSLIATIALKFWNSIAQKSKEVTGGSVQQTLGGSVASEGVQNLVDQTLVATKASGESVTPEQQHVFDRLKP